MSSHAKVCIQLPLAGEVLHIFPGLAFFENFRSKGCGDFDFKRKPVMKLDLPAGVDVEIKLQ